MFDFLAVGIYKMCGLNKSLTILLQWKHTGFQTPQRLWRAISIFADGTSYARSSKQINMVAWVSRLMFFELKSSGWELERRELPWEQNFFILIGVVHVELLACQVLMAVLQIGQDSSIYILDIILGWVYDVISQMMYADDCQLYIIIKRRMVMLP